MQQVRSVQFSSVPTEVQNAALCWRFGATGPEVLLITSRETRRWVIPKGWPIKGLDPQDAAAREAWEEAGVTGNADPRPLGQFTYVKRRDAPDADVLVRVDVYGMQVDAMADSGYPEEGQRVRQWLAPAQAAGLVAEPELAAMITSFVPAAARP